MTGKKPAAIYQGTCTGHGRPIEGHVHNKAVDPCGVTPATAIVKPLATKDATCLWIGFPIAPLATLPLRNVFINSIVPVLDGDVLTNHTSATMHTVISNCCSPTGCAPTVITAPCSMLTAEDQKGVGHPRVVIATCKNVLVNGRPLARVGDPLGPPCLSKIAAGSANVIVGGGDDGADAENAAGDAAADVGTQSADAAAGAGANAGSITPSPAGQQWSARLNASDQAAMMA